MKWASCVLSLALLSTGAFAETEGHLRKLKKPDEEEVEEGGGGEKMVICHRANGKNPYIKLEVSESAKAGHFNEEHNDKFGIDHYIGDEIDYDGKRFLLDENCDLQEIPGEKQPEETSEEKPEIPELPEEKPEVVPKPKPPAKTDGDPHFTMFSGRKFDFHGGCDLVFLDNPDYNNGQGMKIHIRTKIVRWWSYVQTAVVQIGDDTLEVMGGVEKKRYWVNGEVGPKLKDSGVQPFTIGGKDVRFRVLSQSQFQFKIFLEDDQSIVLRSVKDFMKVDIQHHTKETFGTSKGLLGTYEEGYMLARDGRSFLDDPHEFGKEWQVHADEPKLFHSLEGVQHPQTCEMPTATQFQRRLGEQLISREAATRACLHAVPEDLDDCISDVMATGDADMAGAY